jgi:hypothetical protein
MIRELLHADGQTDMVKVIGEFCNFQLHLKVDGGERNEGREVIEI